MHWSAEQNARVWENRVDNISITTMWQSSSIGEWTEPAIQGGSGFWPQVSTLWIAWTPGNLLYYKIILLTLTKCCHLNVDIKLKCQRYRYCLTFDLTSFHLFIILSINIYRASTCAITIPGAGLWAVEEMDNGLGFRKLMSPWDRQWTNWDNNFWASASLCQKIPSLPASLDCS